MYWAECDELAPEAEGRCHAGEGCPEEVRGGVSGKSRLTATLLVLCLGQFGAHRFYAGKTETALSMLLLAAPSWLTPWYPAGWLFVLTLGVWILIDSSLIISGQMDDGRGELISRW